MRFRIPVSILGKALTEGHLGDFPFRPFGDNEDELPRQGDLEFPSLESQEKRPGLYTGSTLLIRGEKSGVYIPDDYLPLIGRFFPRFRLVEIKGAGHWVVSEKMKEVREGMFLIDLFIGFFFAVSRLS